MPEENKQPTKKQIKDLFFSTHAQYLIGLWKALDAIIDEYRTKKKSKDAKKQQADNLNVYLPNLDEIKEAWYNASDLLRISFDLIASFHKAQKAVNKRDDQVKEQMILVNAVVKRVLANPKQLPPLPLADLENHLKFLQSSHTTLEKLSKKLAELSITVEQKIREYGEAWRKNQYDAAEKIVAKLEQDLKITFSEIEKSDLLHTTKTQQELLLKLGKSPVVSLLDEK
ncbi:MAG: hypothetical protein WCW01_05125 [Gammaproteobacteria bacterium]|jgi:hypothetical protein